MVNVPPPAWMILLLAIAGGAGALHPWRTLIDLRFPAAGAALTVIGIGLSVWAWALFRAAGTEIMPNSATNKALLVAGPYRFTRNPMYLSMVLLSLGIALSVGDLPLFAVPLLLFAICNWAHIPFEEAKMRRQFPAAFDAYAAKVRRWL